MVSEASVDVSYVTEEYSQQIKHFNYIITTWLHVICFFFLFL